MNNDAFGSLGSVMVATTTGRGASPEELADRAVDKIMYISDSAHPLLADQARAFRENLRSVLVFYMREAQRAQNVTLVTKFKNAGYPELIPILDA
jgi:hypothetical protein